MRKGAFIHPEFNGTPMKVRTWLNRVAPGILHWKIGENVWAWAPDEDAYLVMRLTRAGFRKSETNPGWMFHTGHTWNGTDVVWMPHENYSIQVGWKNRYVGGYLKNRRHKPAGAKGIRAEYRLEDGLLVLRVDWVRLNEFATARASQALVKALAEVCTVHEKLRWWTVPPVVKPDFTADGFNGSLTGYLSLALRRVSPAPVRNKSLEQERQARRDLGAMVHDPETTMEDKMRLHLQTLRRWAPEDPDVTRALFQAPGLLLPAGISTLADLERKCGKTPTV